MTVIDWQALPSAQALNDAGENTLEELIANNVLPHTYAGTRNSTYSALALLNRLKTTSFEEMLAREKDQDTGLIKTLEFSGFHMYALDPADAYQYWSYSDVFANLGGLNYEQDLRATDYFCYIASEFSGEELSNVVDVLYNILPFQVKELDKSIDAVELPTISEYRNIFALSKILHNEGVVMATNYLWLASRHWDSETVIKLIEERLPIIKAFQFYQMGFTTVEEMKEYDDLIPDDWLLRILGKNADEGVFDYSL